MNRPLARLPRAVSLFKTLQVPPREGPVFYIIEI